MEDGDLLSRMEPGSPVLQADSLMSEPPGKSNCVKVKVKSLSCVQLFDPGDYSLSGSSIHGIFQGRVLEWTAISFSTREVQLCMSGQFMNLKF